MSSSIPATSETAARTCVFVADDGGASVGRNIGIVDACVRGVVREVSVLANGPALDDFADRFAALAPASRPGIGLHVNLTSGPALVGAVDGLTDPRGEFCGDKCAFWGRGLASDLPGDAVFAEIRAQFDRLRERGLAPTRFDGHNHVHLLPDVRAALVRLVAEQAAIGCSRLADPLVLGSTAFPTATLGGLGAWRAHAQAARDAFGQRCVSAGQLLGLDVLGGYSVDDIVVRVAATTASVVEFMCHPGAAGDGTSGFGAFDAREHECAALTDPRLPKELERLGVAVGTFDVLRN